MTGFQEIILEALNSGTVPSVSNLTDYGQIICILHLGVGTYRCFSLNLNKDFPVCVEIDAHYNEYFLLP